MKALALSLFTTFATIANAQSNDNDKKLPADVSLNKTEVTTKNNLTQPDVRAHKGDGAAMIASLDGKIAIHTFP